MAEKRNDRSGAAQPSLYTRNRYFPTDFPLAIYVGSEAPSRDRAVIHTHDFMELCYVLEGVGVHRVAGKEYPVEKGDLYIINMDVSHTFYALKERELLVCNILFDHSLIEEDLLRIDEIHIPVSRLFKNYWYDEVLTADLKSDYAQQTILGQIIRGMMTEWENKRPGWQPMMRAGLLTLMVHILRFMEQPEPDAATSRDRIIELAMAYLRDHYNQPLDLSRLSALSFFSKNYLCRIFKQATGRTLSQTMLTLRVEEACRLLRETDRTVSDIAGEVGFSDYKSFLRHFEEQTRTTPSRYRRGSGDDSLLR